MTAAPDDPIAADLVEEFSFFGDWEERYAHVIALGRDLAPLRDDERVEKNRVHGCASQVWLVAENDDGLMHWRGDSDAFIVKGLIAILIRLLSGREAHTVADFDVAGTLDALGLEGQLTSQRANGLRAMVERMQAEARARLR